MECAVLTKTVGAAEWILLAHIYPEDINRRQVFELGSEKTYEKGIDGMKLVFEKSSDLFGRVTVYNVKIEGTFLS